MAKPFEGFDGVLKAMSLLAKNGAKQLIDKRRWCEVPFARPLGGLN